MPTTYMTPGVYIEEKNAFPGSAVAVPTAVPVFIGYTEKAERNGKSLSHEAVRITSFAEYVEIFGSRFKPRFTIAKADAKVKQDIFYLNGQPSVLQINNNNTSYFYDSVKLFYSNGGSDCYILSVGTYGDTPDGFTISMEDFVGSDTKPNVFDILVKEYEPTLVVIPDIIALGKDSYDLYKLVLMHCNKVQSRFGIFDLAYQSKNETIDDVISSFRDLIGTNFLSYGAAYYPWLKTSIVQPSELDFENLDDSVDLENLLPEPKARELVRNSKPKLLELENRLTALKDQPENTPEQIKKINDDIKSLKPLPDDQVGVVEGNLKPLTDQQQKLQDEIRPLEAALRPVQAELKPLEDELNTLKDQPDKAEQVKALQDRIQPLQDQIKPLQEKRQQLATLNDQIKPLQDQLMPVAMKQKSLEEQLLPVSVRQNEVAVQLYQLKKNYHQSLRASSITYVNILDELRSRLNELPPSGAMAGVYALTDSSRGVWKAPANVSLSMVQAPMINISHDQQQTLNVDVMAGKSVNVIRPFPGIGTLVWGARTLDGNSQDWRYINVRRTLIMLEQSIKLATRAYVFEPNNPSTWVTVSSMINNFLYNIWRQGALFGAVPEQAYNVQIGLGSTMTPSDILDGVMRITIKVAVVKPAEFIVITFQQQQQQA